MSSIMSIIWKILEYTCIFTYQVANLSRSSKLQAHYMSLLMSIVQWATMSSLLSIIWKILEDSLAFNFPISPALVGYEPFPQSCQYQFVRLMLGMPSLVLILACYICIILAMAATKQGASWKIMNRVQMSCHHQSNGIH